MVDVIIIRKLKQSVGGTYFASLGHFLSHLCQITVKILKFWTDTFGQTVQTQIRLLLLLEEQSDLGLHCLLFHLHHLS